MPDIYLTPEDFSPQDMWLKNASIKEAKLAIQPGKSFHL